MKVVSESQLVLAGSAWAASVLEAKGVSNVEVLPMGIDTAKFFPRDGPGEPVYHARLDGMDYSGQFEDRFVIYSVRVLN